MTTGTWPHGRSRDGGVDQVPLPGAAGRGQLWICGKHAVGPDVDALLARIGGHLVVCLTERHELADRYPAYVTWLELDVRAVWHPVHDLCAPPLDAFVSLVDLVHGHLRAGEIVLAHCAAGVGRSGTLAVGVCLRDGMPLDVALAHVAAHRPMAGPEVGSQRALVEAYASHLRGAGRDASAPR